MKTTETQKPAFETVREVASILAAGLMRCNARTLCAAESSIKALGFPAPQSNDPAPLVNASENDTGGRT